MKVQRLITAVVMAAVALTWLGTPAQAADELTTQQMSAELKALKAELAQLKAQQNETWLTERRAEEVKTLVRDVLADAETRSSLMDSAVTAGHNGENFFIASEDGSFLFVPHGYMQARYIANFRSADDGSNTDEGEAGFEITRAKFQGKGHIYGPQLRYYFSTDVVRHYTDTDDIDLGIVFEDYYVEYDLDEVTGIEGLMVRGGRFRQPFLRENLIDASQQMAVERSLINEFFNVDRSEAVMLAYGADMWKAMLSFHNGTEFFGLDGHNDFNGDLVGPTNWDTLDSFFGAGSGTDFAMAARVDVKLAGEWSQWDDFAAWDGEPMAVFVGAAVNYEVAETGVSAANWQTLGWTLDASLEYERFGLFAAGYGHHLIDSDDSTFSGAGGVSPEPEWNNYGLQVMASYQVVPNQIEPFIRYEVLMLDDDIVSAMNDDDSPDTDYEDTLNLLTFGVNWYGHKHDSKFTFDVVWALEPLDNPMVANGVGLQGHHPENQTFTTLGLMQDDNGNDGQVAVRAQYQLKF